MSNLSAYNRNNQIEILQLTIKKPNTEQVLDMSQVMDQIIIYEDVFQTALSARLIFRDQVNLVGSLPIVGGEIVNIKYRTPVYDEVKSLEFRVYKIGDRGIGNTSENIQLNQLYLCTPEVWWASNNLVCAAFKGTYTEIIQRLLNEASTKKSIDKEDSLGIVDYVPPGWNIFKSAKFCAGRAVSKTMSPMFFWETAKGYHFKSLKEMYRAPYDKFLYIEDRSVAGAEYDANKAFNTCFSFEYPESNDRLTQYTVNAFGVDNFSVDISNARVMKQANSYDDFFHKSDIKLNKYPLNDDNDSQRGNLGFIPFRKDQSHVSEYNRKASLAFMDNVRLLVTIPGDSELKAGDVVSLDIPARVGLNIGIEEHTSGKWLVRSMKHLITKNTYTQTCELTKDSFDRDVVKGG
jgi:hypothetical protein